MEKRIVFLRSNPVDSDSRVEKEANSLNKAGYDVKIVAWDRSEKYGIKESFLNLNNGKVKIHRFGIPAKYGAGFKSLKPFCLFQIRLLIWLIRNKNQYDIIHACDFDTAYTAYNFARIFKKKLVFDIFDFLYTYPEGKFKLFKNYIKKLQLNIINYADGTIICTEKRIDQIKGSKPRKLAIIHNSPPEISNTLERLDLNKNKIKIAYVGILQDKRFLIELADVVKSMDMVELHIGGFGKYENYFEEMSKKTSNIFYYGKLSYQETLQLEDSCDIMTAIYDPAVDNHFFAAPNKFYEALMLGKPLIMVKNTGMADIVAQYKLGEVIEYNTQSLKLAIERLASRQPEWKDISIRMKRLYVEQFSWCEMENRLIEFYREIY